MDIITIVGIGFISIALAIIVMFFIGKEATGIAGILLLALYALVVAPMLPIEFILLGFVMFGLAAFITAATYILMSPLFICALISDRKKSE